MRLIHIEEPEHKEEIVRKQAKTILKIKPDVILFEFPIQNRKRSSLSYFNKFKPNKKPQKVMKDVKQHFKLASKRYPWLKSEHKIFEALEQLWHEGKQIYLFEIDGPVELTSAGEGTRYLLNIIWNYLREKYMVENIRKIESKMSDNRIALVLCHNFHWTNLQFLLKKPSKEKIWDYYFVRNGITKSPKEVGFELKKQNEILYKYWKLKSDFLRGARGN